MILPLDKLIIKYKLDIQGVIHIGAHWGQEYFDYVKSGVKSMLFFEPVASNYEKLLKTISKKKNAKTFNLALGNEVGTKKMYIETYKGQSCSLLEPALHLKLYPNIKFDSRETVKIDKLDNIDFDHNLHNMINVDVQGFELEVFKGAVKTLESIDIIYTEVNFKEIYKNCCLVGVLDDFLKRFGFIRILTSDQPKAWGDALYLKY